MKTIAQYVKDGINTIQDLQDALQTAMQLEFATIPPYLCAQWSINDDPDDVGDMIQDIVVQEMYHFALAGNILTAIGGTPNIANSAFIPQYPTNTLPGGIAQKLAVDLKPLSLDQLQVFMQIEYPEFTPVALAARAAGPATIGAFYDTIADALTALNPPINSAAFSVNMNEAVPITTVANAVAAISRIKAEGEGTQGSPDQPPADGVKFAHYYVFKEIFTGKTLQQTNGQWGFTGQQIRFPTVYNFAPSTQKPDPSTTFNQTLSQLLVDLQTCWTSGAPPNVGTMFTLQSLGQGLIQQQGIRPGFVWATPAA
jgi:hypothetical protein